MHNATHKCFAIRIHPGFLPHKLRRQLAKDPEAFYTFENDTMFKGSINEPAIQEHQDATLALTPVMLFSKKTNKAGLMALLAARHTDGTWILTVQCLAPKEISQHWSVSITVSNGHSEGPTYTFNGKPVSQELNILEAYTSGHCLTIHRHQVQAFRKADTDHLFDWKIALTLDKKHEEDCLEISRRMIEKTHGSL